MNRLMSKRVVLTCLWLVALSTCFFAGTGEALAALPKCVKCGCKAVYCWYLPPGDFAGRGAKDPGTTNGVDFALIDIYTAAGCQAGALAQNGTCDLWNYLQTYWVCNMANQNTFIQEVSPVDAGFVFQRDGNRLKCE